MFKSIGWRAAATFFAVGLLIGIVAYLGSGDVALLIQAPLLLSGGGALLFFPLLFFGDHQAKVSRLQVTRDGRLRLRKKARTREVNLRTATALYMHADEDWQTTHIEIVWTSQKDELLVPDTITEDVWRRLLNAARPFLDHAPLQEGDA